MQWPSGASVAAVEVARAGMADQVEPSGSTLHAAPAA
jgi:hypothetical protein